MTAPRQVVPGRTYLFTRRCAQRQFLLRPDTPTENIVLYCLAEAAQRYRIAVHAFIAMGNHVHIVFRDELGNYPRFIEHMDKMMAKAINALRRRRENLWSVEQPSVVHLVNPEDCFAKIIYCLTNPVLSDLVDRVTDWPGASSLRMHFHGKAKVLVRPRYYFSDTGRMPEEVSLQLERPDGFDDLSDDQWRGRIQTAVESCEAAARKLRLAEGRGVVGRKNILRLNPWDTPTRERKSGIRPSVACRDPARRSREIVALRAFRARYRAALVRFNAGERDVLFPFGTYWLRRFRGHLHVEDGPESFPERDVATAKACA